jgi:hypothetical protein
MADVTKTAMPQLRGNSSNKSMWWCSRGHRVVEWVERADAIAPGNQAPGPEVLHRKTKGVKLNKTSIISGELTNGNKVFDYVGGTRTLSRWRGPTWVEPVAVIGSIVPSPTMMEEGVEELGG